MARCDQGLRSLLLDLNPIPLAANCAESVEGTLPVLTLFLTSQFSHVSYLKNKQNLVLSALFAGERSQHHPPRHCQSQGEYPEIAGRSEYLSSLTSWLPATIFSCGASHTIPPQPPIDSVPSDFFIKPEEKTKVPCGAMYNQRSSIPSLPESCMLLTRLLNFLKLTAFGLKSFDCAFLFFVFILVERSPASYLTSYC